MTTAKIYIRNTPNEEWRAVSLDEGDRIASSLYVYASGCTALTSLDAKAAKTVDASGCTALTSLDAKAAKTVDASGCTALTSLDAKAAEYVDASGCTALTSLDAKAAKTVDASGCTALTSLDAKAAKTVDASGCTALTSLDAKAAEYVYASGCTALTSLDAKAAEYVYASGCTALTSLDAKAAKYVGILANEHTLIADLKPWREEMVEAERLFTEADPQIGDWCMWLHHEISFEQLSEPWQNRFKYIATQKPEDEKAWRFRMIRPFAKDAMREAGITVD